MIATYKIASCISLYRGSKRFFIAIDDVESFNYVDIDVKRRFFAKQAAPSKAIHDMSIDAK